MRCRQEKKHNHSPQTILLNCSHGLRVVIKKSKNFVVQNFTGRYEKAARQIKNTLLMKRSSFSMTQWLSAKNILYFLFSPPSLHSRTNTLKMSIISLHIDKFFTGLNQIHFDLDSDNNLLKESRSGLTLCI